MHQESPEILERLQAAFLFSGWREKDLIRLGEGAKLRHPSKGEALFAEGDRCDWLHILLRGQVQMFAIREDGGETTLHMVGPGALVGCAALFLDRAYPAYARAASSGVELLSIRGAAFLALLEKRPDLARRMIATLAMRLSELAASLESRGGESAAARLARWILDQPSEKSDGGVRIVAIPGTKKALAQSLGMTPETLSRSLKKMVDGEIIQAQGKRIEIRDGARLMEFE